MNLKFRSSASIGKRTPPHSCRSAGKLAEQAMHAELGVKPEEIQGGGLKMFLQFATKC